MLTESGKIVLVELLARERMLYWPYRAADWNASGSVPAREEAKREFLALGLRHRSPGTPTERKEAERVLGQLENLNLLTHNGRIRKTHIRLTGRGRELASALAGVPTLLVAT